MKKILIISFIIFITLSGYGQRFIGSVIFGGNLTQVDGDEVYGYYKPGFNAGASVTVPLDRKYRWFATVELLYTQKGSHQTAYRANAHLVDTLVELDYHNEDYSVPFDNKTKYKLTMDYVEVPVLFHYEDWHTGWSIGAGFAWGRLVRAHEIENGWTTTTTARNGVYKRDDWSVIADLKVRIWKGLRLNFRFQYSMVPLRIRTYNQGNPNEEVRKQYHNMLTLRLIYSFNEKWVKNNDWVRGGRNGTKWLHDTSRGWYGDKD